MELWDLYDAQRQPMNKLQMRGKPIPEGYYHIVVFIWLQHPVELDKLQLQEKETIDAMLVDQSTFEDMMRVHILTHPLQLWYHELKDTLAVYFQKNR